VPFRSRETPAAPSGPGFENAEENRKITAAAVAETCPTLKTKSVHPHTLRHSSAMSLLQARVDSTVIALWLGHADTSSTQRCIHADMSIKQRALALLTPPAVKPGRYVATDDVMAYLNTLG
jgi:integrase